MTQRERVCEGDKGWRERTVEAFTDTPDARECGLVEGGSPISARHVSFADCWFNHRLLGDGTSRDGVGDNKGFGLAHHALEVDVGIVARPLPDENDGIF